MRLKNKFSAAKKGKGAVERISSPAPWNFPWFESTEQLRCKPSLQSDWLPAQWLSLQRQHQRPAADLLESPRYCRCLGPQDAGLCAPAWDKSLQKETTPTTDTLREEWRSSSNPRTSA